MRRGWTNKANLQDGRMSRPAILIVDNWVLPELPVWGSTAQESVESSPWLGLGTARELQLV